VEDEPRLDQRRYLAAKSDVPMRAVCEAIRERYELPPFWYDCEVEGEDSWVYAHAQGLSLGLNVTQIGEFVNPSVWTWMWGAPDRANYQIILSWDSSRINPQGVSAIEAAFAELLGSPIIPYPDSKKTEPRAAPDPAA
jgi:hypothetical protein